MAPQPAGMSYAAARRRITSIINKRREDFSSEKEYNDYLEHVEDLSAYPTGCAFLGRLVTEAHAMLRLNVSLQFRKASSVSNGGRREGQAGGAAAGA